MRKPKLSKPQLKPSQRLQNIVDLLDEFESDFLCLDTDEGTEFCEGAGLLEGFVRSLEIEGL